MKGGNKSGKNPTQPFDHTFFLGFQSFYIYIYIIIINISSIEQMTIKGNGLMRNCHLHQNTTAADYEPK